MKNNDIKSIITFKEFAQASGKPDFSLNKDTNNVSVANEEDLSREKLPFLMPLGTKLQSGMKFATQEQKYGIRIGLTDDLGYLSSNLVLTLSSKDSSLIQTITIYFDDDNEQFVTEAIIDGETFYNDDAIWTIIFENPANTKTIEFIRWNKPNYNVVIKDFNFELGEKTFNLKEIEKIKLTDQIMPYQSEPYFDVLSTVGYITLKDIYGELNDYAEDGILKPNIECRTFANDFVTATLFVNEWEDYDIQNKKITANLKDKLYDLDSYAPNISLLENDNLFNIAKEVLVPNVFATVNDFTNSLSEDFLTNENEEITLSEYLINKIIPYFFQYQRTYRQFLKDFCEIANLNCYTDNNSKIHFESSRPRFTEISKNNIVEILPRAQRPNWQEKIQPKNEYTYVETKKCIVSDYVDYDVIVSTYANSNPTISVEENDDDWVVNTGENGSAVAYTELTSYYTDLFIRVDKKNTNGLKQVKKIYSGIDGKGDPEIKTTLTYKKEVGTIADQFTENVNLFYTKPTNFDITITNVEENLTSDLPSLSVTTSEDFLSMTATSTTTLVDKNTLSNPSITEYSTFYMIGIKILTGMEKIAMSGNINTLPFITPSRILNGKIYEKYTPQKIEVSFYGDQRIVEFNYETISSGSKNNNIYINSNDNILLQDVTSIQSSIIEDYSTKNGIRIASVTVVANINYNNSNGISIVIWNGEDNKPTILQKGMIVDVIGLDGKSHSRYKNQESRYWKITGIEQNYGNSNYFLVELREIW